MTDSIKSNKELTEYWNACKANSEEWEFAIPKTSIQVLSVQKRNYRFCPIK